jgi:hypothetical protein
LWEHHHGEIISKLEISNGQIEISDFSGQQFTFDAKTGHAIGLLKSPPTWTQ